MEFKVGDRVEFYFGDDKCEGVIKKVKPYGRYEITDDDYIFYDTSIDNITKITKEKKKTTLEELERRIEKLELYIEQTNERPIQYKTNIEEIEKQIEKNIVEIKSVMGEQNNLEKSENASNLKKNDLLNEDERVILRNLDNKWKWITRDEDGDLKIHVDYPFIIKDYWMNKNDFEFLDLFNHIFQFIKWGDKPYNIEKLLKGACDNE